MKERIKILKKIFPYVNKYKIGWALLFGLKVGQRVPILVQPLILRAFIVSVIDNKELTYMFVIAWMYIGLYLLETVLKVCHRIVDNSLFNRITSDLRKILFSRYTQMSNETMASYKNNDLVRRLNFDIDMVKFFLVGQVFDYISYVVLIVISITLMFLLEWHLALVAIILLPFSLWLSRKYKDSIEKNGEKNRNLISTIEERVAIISSSWKEVKANGLEKHQEKDFNHILESYIDCKYENTEIHFHRKLALDLKESIVDILGIYIAGGIFSIFYNVTAGTVIACIGYYNNVLDGIHEIMEANSSLNWMKPSIIRVIEILDLSMGKEEICKKQDEKSSMAYDCENICFKYEDSNKNIIQDLSFKIHEGEKVLFAGVSGSGKSTLIKILAGELKPANGSIAFRGMDLADYSLPELYNDIRIVDQNTYCMNVSAREFLQMAKQDASDDEMKRVCGAVNLWEDTDTCFIRLDYTIGENGSYLSKGQKQKLILARLLLDKNKIIILDEAFSAIDSREKVSIIDLILEHFQEETIICVAHDEEIKRKFSSVIKIGNI